MGFLYTATQDAVVSGTGSRTLFNIAVATDVPIVLHWLELGQTSDLGEAQEEVLKIYLAIGGTGYNGGASLTPVAVHDRAPASTAVVNGEAAIGTGAIARDISAWNIRRAGPAWLPLPGQRWHINAANDPIVFILTAISDSITLGATVCWEEL